MGEEKRADSRMTRRRALRAVAAVAGLPLMMAGVRALAPGAQAHTWRGEVLGAPAELALWHSDGAFAQRTILKVRSELVRLERIFSLYRPDSEIARLNRDGQLLEPSRELRALVEQSQRIGELSGGAFDISVQPLWRLYEAHFWSHAEIQPDIAARARDISQARVDFRRIDSGVASIAFARPHMAITLNSIAQGYITDRVAGMLRNEGYESAVVDMGEVCTIGRHPDGRPWRLGIRNAKQPGAVERSVELEDLALAVSGGYGTTFDSTGRFHHIFDPRTGASANTVLDVAVIGPSAAVANAIATALCAGGEALAPALLAAHPNTRAIVTHLDGSSVTLSANRSAGA